MNKAHIQLLNQRYEEVCEDYLKAFCKAYDLEYDNDSWVAGEVGTIACVSDHFFDFNDVIKFAVDNNLSDYDELLEWEDYLLFAHEYNLTLPNFKSWHNGCPRLILAERERLQELKADFENALQEYKKNTTQTF